MFKDVSIWCVILGLVILMFVHHILSDKPLFEGNENIDEEEPAEEVAGDSTVETEVTIEGPQNQQKHQPQNQPKKPNKKIIWIFHSLKV